MFKIKIGTKKKWRFADGIRPLPAPLTEAPEGFLHAWFSKRQSEHGGTNIYISADLKKPIEITEVSSQPGGPCHPDALYLGLVTTWMLRGLSGSFAH